MIHCGGKGTGTNQPKAAALVRPSGPDVSTQTHDSAYTIEHFDLELAVDFKKRELKGHVTHTLKRRKNGDKLIVDTRDLDIASVETSADGKTFAKGTFELAPPQKNLGQALSIPIPDGTRFARISYSTRPTASGLGWLEPAQTAGKKQPFLFSQAQATHARSFIPLQDSPAIRMTYTATVKVPPPLFAAMSAENVQERQKDGVYRFRMPQAIPSYLIALAVGDLKFKSLGPRSGVYAEPSVLDKAAREFEDLEKMIATAERLYGPYRWGRYDVLVLPPSFPYGGMENPRLTFATPTILAGDKSLVSLIAHELAHSWSGNLVSNATWRDIWLNEGFTVYVERRIVEEIYGLPFARMERLLGRQQLAESMPELKPAQQMLHIPNEAMDTEDSSDIPYEKGVLFLETLESKVGRDAFDSFLRSYFDAHAFRAITTADFVTYLLEKKPEWANQIDLETWIYGPGLPKDVPVLVDDRFAVLSQRATDWAGGKGALPAEAWSFHEFMHFLRALPQQLTPKQMDELEKNLRIADSGNAEIQSQWLLMSIRNGYAKSDARVDAFLLTVGRRKLIMPIYEELLKTPAGRKRAQSIFKKARPGYHPITTASVEALLKKDESQTK
jgi:aminopeptidase N